MATPARIARMAQLAVRSESLHDVPAEMSFSMCAVESEWLRPEKSLGNNCLGIKYAGRHTGKQPWLTKEILTQRQLDALPAEKKARIARKVRRPDGERWDVMLSDDFATFPSFEACFDDHARIVRGEFTKRYRAPWIEYERAGDLQALFAGICAVYATAQYGDLAWRISQQLNVKRALADAREEQVSSSEKPKEKEMSDTENALGRIAKLIETIRKDSPELKNAIDWLVANGAPQPEITEETVSYAGGSYMDVNVVFSGGGKEQKSGAYLIVHNPSVALVELRGQGIATGDAGIWVPYTPPGFKTDAPVSGPVPGPSVVAAQKLLTEEKNPDGSTPTAEQVAAARKAYWDWHGIAFVKK